MAKKIKRITIDPGATGSGWAVWDSEWKLINNGIINPSVKNAGEKLEWEAKAYWVAAKISEVCELFDCTEGYIEYPAFFQSHGACGVANSGALVKLAWFVGLVCGSLPFAPRLVTVGSWKGQLPKKVVISRIKRILPNVKATSHDYDAIGIGLYLKGDLK